MPFYRKQGNIKKERDKRMSAPVDFTEQVERKRVSLRASMTVEGVLAVPCFFFAVITLVSMIQICAVRSRIQRALFEDARELAKYSYAKEAGEEFFDIASDENLALINAGINVATAKVLLVRNLGADYGSEHGIIGGTAGILLPASEIEEDGSKIRLQADYAVKLPFSMFGAGIIPMEQKAETCGWTGMRAEDEETDGAAEDEITVYVTRTGEVYHKDPACTYLHAQSVRVPLIQVKDLRNADGSKYYPCELCKEQAAKAEPMFVYITDYGTRYHLVEDCPTLNHEAKAVKLSEVAGRRPCSKCGG